MSTDFAREVERRTRTQDFSAAPEATVSAEAIEIQREGGTFEHHTKLFVSVQWAEAELAGIVIRAINEAASWALREVEVMRAERARVIP